MRSCKKQGGSKLVKDLIVILCSMNNKWAYWLCQFTGWFGMVAVETINYTFFIVGKFNAEVFWAFIMYAVLGMACTHLYRYCLNKTDFFHKKALSIWLIALLSTILISSVLSLVNFVPELIKDPAKFFKQLRFIEIAGTIINWMRYVGVWVIIYFMYKILQQKNAILQEKLSLENLAKTTELELLKTQLNPHFLFNALNSIKALVTINPEQSREAIVKLSELLRFTLQYGKERLIPINDEVAEVKKYLELEQLRFGERVIVQFDIDPNTLNQTIPPAIVLTLAENAVKHGVAKQIQTGVIVVNTTISAKHLLVQVINSGHYHPDGSAGIGLKHVVKRLEEVYHNQASFQIHNEGDNVVATIQIPLS